MSIPGSISFLNRIRDQLRHRVSARRFQIPLTTKILIREPNVISRNLFSRINHKAFLHKFMMSIRFVDQLHDSFLLQCREMNLVSVLDYSFPSKSVFGKCHKSSYCRQTPEHDPDHADIYEGFAMVGADFIVTNQPAGLNQPAEGPLPNPPFGQD